MKLLISILALALSKTAFAVAPDALDVQKQACESLRGGMKLVTACVSTPKASESAEAAAMFKAVTVCGSGSRAILIFSDGTPNVIQRSAYGRSLKQGRFTYVSGNDFALEIPSTSQPGDQFEASFIVHRQPKNIFSTYTCTKN